MPQLSIDDEPGIAYPGQIAEAAAPRMVRSMSCEDDGLVSGQIVCRGTDPYEQIDALPTSAFTPSFANIAGVVLFSSSKPFSDPQELEADDRVSVLRRGSVYLEFSEAVEAGEEVGYTLATGVLTGIAAGTAAGSIATGIVVIPGLRIEQTTDAAGVAIVSVNLEGVQNSATVGSA
jgi:hypothetical protein